VTGTGFTTLHSFSLPVGTNGIYGTNSDGAYNRDGLILSGDTLYGTALDGGTNGTGTVFAVNTNGGFTNLHNFGATFGTKGGRGTNSDGVYPYAGLILSGSTLYGTADVGGLYGYGTVFAVNSDGTGFRTLYSFKATSGSEGVYGTGTNSDGAYTYGALILSGNTLYGTAQVGGLSGNGTVFAVKTNGTGFTTLHSFTELSGSGGWNDEGTNSDGAVPQDEHGLILSGSTLYGTTVQGGLYGNGTVFAVNTNGTGFTTLYGFTELSGSGGGDGINADGALPVGGLILSGNTLYGTGQIGGTAGYGTVFSLALPAPRLTLAASDTNVVLTWPTNYGVFDYTGYTLLTTTNLASPAVWATNSPAPVVVNGQFTVTNPISGAQQFYRLSQQ